MTLCKIPYDFIRQRTQLRWAEVVFGFEHQLIDAQAAAALANEKIAGGDLAAELKMVEQKPPNDSLALLISILATGEPVVEIKTVKAKWLYLLLAWLYENRGKLTDPLGLVELVHGQFGEPKEMQSFVRSINSGSPPELMEEWRQYLEKTEPQFV